MSLTERVLNLEVRRVENQIEVLKINRDKIDAQIEILLKMVREMEAKSDHLFRQRTKANAMAKP